MVHTVLRSEGYPGRTRDGREFNYPTAPDVIFLGYEGIIGGQERPLASRGHMRGAVLAVKGDCSGL
jgi:hypothetical protein